MPYIDVRIMWDEPEQENWMNPDNLKLCLRKTCPNTNFEVVYLSKKQDESDEEMIDDLHKLAMEDEIPDWVACGGSD